MKTHSRPQDRRGHVLVTTVLMMIVMIGIVALAVDLGYLHVVRSPRNRPTARRRLELEDVGQNLRDREVETSGYFLIDVGAVIKGSRQWRCFIQGDIVGHGNGTNLAGNQLDTLGHDDRCRHVFYVITQCDGIMRRIGDNDIRLGDLLHHAPLG